MSLHYLLAGIFLLALQGAAAAQADQADQLGRRLAASCANCHGTDGRSAGGTVPGLAGLSEENIITALKEFKAGTRTATIMRQLANGYTDEQIALIAAYFAAQKK